MRRAPAALAAALAFAWALVAADLAATAGPRAISVSNHGGPVVGLAYAPDGRWLASAGGWDGTVRLWDALSLRPVQIPRPFIGSYAFYYLKTVAFSPDGRYLAWALVMYDPNEDGEESDIQQGRVEIWDRERQAVVTTIDQRGGVNCLAFSPDGRNLAGGGYQYSRVWQVASGKELARLGARGPAATAVAYSRDGRSLAVGGSQGAVARWDTRGWRDVVTYPSLPSAVRAVAFSPDGALLAAGGVGGLRLWETASGRERLVDNRQRSEVRAVTFAPDGRWFVAGGEAPAPGARGLALRRQGELRAWDPATGRLLATRREPEAFAALAVAPGGKALVVGFDGGVLMTLNPSGLATIARTKDVTLRTAAPGPPGVAPRNGGYRAFQTAQVLADRVRFRDLETGATWVVKLAAPRPPMPAGAERVLSPDRTRVAATDGGRTAVWNAITGRLVAQWGAALPERVDAMYDRPLEFHFSADVRQLILVRHNGGVSRWDAASGRSLAEIRGRGRSLVIGNGVTASPNGAWLLRRPSHAPSGLWQQLMAPDYSHSIEVLDPVTGVLRHTLASGLKTHAQVAWSADDKLLAAGLLQERLGLLSSGKYFSIHVWDAASGRALATPARDLDELDFLAFSPAGHTLVAGIEAGTVAAWDAGTGTELARIADPDLPIPDPGTSLTYSDMQASEPRFTPDGRLLAWSGAGALHVADLRWGRLLASIPAPGARPLQLSPDGARLLATGPDGFLTIWDATRRRVLLRFSEFPSGDWLAFTPDGRYDGTATAIATAYWLWGANLYPFASLPLDYRTPGLWAKAWRGALPVGPNLSADILAGLVPHPFKPVPPDEPPPSPQVRAAAGFFYRWLTPRPYQPGIAAFVLLAVVLYVRDRHRLGLLLRRWRLDRLALAVLRTIGPRNRRYRSAQWYVGRLLTDMGRREEAVAAYRAAARLYPSWHHVHHVLGLELATLGRTEEGIAALEEASRVDPGHKDTRVLLGALFYLAGRHADAEAEAREAHALDLKASEPLLLLGHALADLGRPEEAAEVLRRAAEADPADASPHAALGKLSLDRREFAAAVPHLQEAVRLDPDNVRTWVSLGMALGESGRLDESIAASSEALRLAPDDSTAHYNLACALALQGQRQPALEALARAVELEPACRAEARVDGSLASLRADLTFVRLTKAT